MIALKSGREIECIKRAGMVVAEVLDNIQRTVTSGMTTQDVDDFTNELLNKYNSAEPAFLGYRGFPKSICVSINEQVVHGIPSRDKIIGEGDVVSLDFGVCMKGYYADAAVSFQVPPFDPEVQRFLSTCKEALQAGLEKTLVGNRVGDISSAIQKTVESSGYNVVKSLVGHGIGRNLHEEPQVPNYGNSEEGILLQEGMVLAIEPMINMGASGVKTLDDEWTIVTIDGSLSAHFEHTVVVKREGPDVLTVSAERMAASNDL